MAFTGMHDRYPSNGSCSRLIHLTFPYPPLIANPQSVEIKHAGKQHKVEFNPVGDAKAFKESIYQVTGVPTGKFFS